MARSQPYRLDPPVTKENLPQIVTNADEMFQILFEEVAALEDSITAVEETAATTTTTTLQPQMLGLFGSAVEGDRGMMGVPGLTGSQGLMGLQGPPGQQGDEGPAGAPGVAGAAGAAGANGADGQSNIPGPRGEDGDCASFIGGPTNKKVELSGDVLANLVSVPFAAGDFTGDTGTWTVASGDVNTFKYLVIDHMMLVTLELTSTSVDVATPPTILLVLIPAGKRAVNQSSFGHFFSDNGVNGFGLVQVNPGDPTHMRFLTPTIAAWTPSVNNTYVRCTILFEIET